MINSSPYFTLDDLQRIVDYLSISRGWTVTRLRVSHATRRYIIKLAPGWSDVRVDADIDMLHGRVEFWDDKGGELDEGPRVFRAYPADHFWQTKESL